MFHVSPATFPPFTNGGPIEATGSVLNVHGAQLFPPFTNGGPIEAAVPYADWSF